MISPEFLITALIVILVPGTGVIFTVSTALARGTRAAIIAAIGCTLGILPHIAAAILGITAILNLSAIVFRVVRFIGVAYLLYMAYSMWKNTETLKIETRSSNDRGLKIIGRAVLLNLLNPKLTLFFMAFLPQFLSFGSTSRIESMLALSGLFMFMTLVVFIAYGVASSAARQALTKSPKLVRWIQRTFAGLLALFALRLALADE